MMRKIVNIIFWVYLVTSLIFQLIMFNVLDPQSRFKIYAANYFIAIVLLLLNNYLHKEKEENKKTKMTNRNGWIILCSGWKH